MVTVVFLRFPSFFCYLLFLFLKILVVSVSCFLTHLVERLVVFVRLQPCVVYHPLPSCSFISLLVIQHILQTFWAPLVPLPKGTFLPSQQHTFSFLKVSRIVLFCFFVFFHYFTMYVYRQLINTLLLLLQGANKFFPVAITS